MIRLLILWGLIILGFWALIALQPLPAKEISLDCSEAYTKEDIIVCLNREIKEEINIKDLHVMYHAGVYIYYAESSDTHYWINIR